MKVEEAVIIEQQVQHDSPLIHDSESLADGVEHLLRLTQQEPVHPSLHNASVGGGAPTAP
jgi:hypothetical protein